MKNNRKKTTTIIIVLLFVISLFLSTIIVLRNNVSLPNKPSEKNFAWPVVNTNLLEESINDYDGGINEDIFKSNFESSFSNKWENGKYVSSRLKFTYEFGDDIVVHVDYNKNNEIKHLKEYEFQLIYNSII